MVRLAKLDQAEAAALVLRVAVTMVVGDEDAIDESGEVDREVLERKLRRQLVELQLPVNTKDQSRRDATGRHANVSGRSRNFVDLY